MFNPESFSNKFEADYEDQQGRGSSGSPQVFNGIKPRELSLEFTIDGTNAVSPIEVSSEYSGTLAPGAKIDVETKVQEFRRVCIDYNGSIHRPYYLYILWGTFYMYGVMKSADVKYSLFDREGNPLRAKVTATFSENVSDVARERMERNSSPDLTHIRIVEAGDTLPLMANRIYNDPSYYLQVAKVNNLKNFRKLIPGQKLIFPPLSKTDTQ
jgi:LysM repeat protein